MENNQTTVCRIPKLTIQREYVGIGTRLTAIRDQLTCWSHLYLTKKTSADLQNHYCFQFSGEFQPCWTEGACDVLIFVTFKTPVILKEFALHESCVKWKVRKMKKNISLFLQSCTKDEECCGEELCVWGQCSQNATKGEPGSTCQYQTDCNPDLCCAFHKGTVQHTVQYVLLSDSLHYLTESISMFYLRFQHCSSPSARPSPLSVSAALVPPTTW